MLKKPAIKLIVFYQKYISKKSCLYYPTCSEYTLEAIHIHGFFLGVLLGAYRILRCNPFSKGGFDPVPEHFLKVRWVL